MPKAIWLKSERVRQALENVAQAMTGNYNLKLRFGQSVYTDCQTIIEVNPDICMSDALPEWMQYLLLQAQRDHEVAHQFTDHDMKIRAMQHYAPDRIKGMIAADIANILEDARVELAQSNETPGCAPIFLFANTYVVEHLHPHNSTIGNLPRVIQFTRGLVQKACSGRYKGRILDDTVWDLLRRCEPIIERARYAPNSSAVLDLTYQVVQMIEPLIEELKQKCQDYESQSTSNNDKSGSKQPKVAPAIRVDFQRFDFKNKDDADESKNNGNTDEEEHDEEHNRQPKEESNDVDDDVADEFKEQDGNGGTSEDQEEADAIDGACVDISNDDESVVSDGLGGEGADADNDQNNHESSDNETEQEFGTAEQHDDACGEMGSFSKDNNDYSVQDGNFDAEYSNDHEGSNKGSGDAVDVDEEDELDDENGELSDNKNEEDDVSQRTGFNTNYGEASFRDNNQGANRRDNLPTRLPSNQRSRNDDEVFNNLDGQYFWDSVGFEKVFADLKNRAEKEIEQIKDDIEGESQSGVEHANSIDHIEREPELTKEELLEGISIFGIHEGVKLVLKNPESNINVSAYNMAFELVSDYARILETELLRLIRWKVSTNSMNKKKGRLYKRSLYRVPLEDDRIFYKQNNTSKIDKRSVAIKLLVDISGSMNIDNRWASTMATAILMHTVLRNLRIRHSVTGFTTGGRSVLHEEYISFSDCFSQDVSKRLGAIRATAENRDGFSLRVAGNILKRRSEKRKVLFVVSDGYPNHEFRSYTDHVAIRDTHDAVVELNQNGITVIGISIGKEHNHMPKIYTNYIAVPNVHELPSKMANLLRDIFV